MTDNEHLRDKLHTTNRRMTRQRQLVFDTLQHSHDHLDVESLYQRTKAHDSNISLATVYRTLAVLKKMGLVEEHQFGEDHSHFEVAHPAPHYHFTCLKCKQVLEFDAPQVMEAARRLSEQEGLHITDAHLFLSGYCSKCRNHAEAK